MNSLWCRLHRFQLVFRDFFQRFSVFRYIFHLENVGLNMTIQSKSLKQNMIAKLKLSILLTIIMKSVVYSTDTVMINTRNSWWVLAILVYFLTRWSFTSCRYVFHTTNAVHSNNDMFSWVCMRPEYFRTEQSLVSIKHW